jgi:hypothetical protein
LADFLSAISTQSAVHGFVVTKLVDALEAQRFTGGEIEFDEGKFQEVEEATYADGKKYDLDLDQSLEVIKKERIEDIAARRIATIGAPSTPALRLLTTNCGLAILPLHQPCRRIDLRLLTRIDLVLLVSVSRKNIVFSCGGKWGGTWKMGVVGGFLILFGIGAAATGFWESPTVGMAALGGFGLLILGCLLIGLDRIYRAIWTSRSEVKALQEGVELLAKRIEPRQAPTDETSIPWSPRMPPNWRQEVGV